MDCTSNKRGVTVILAELEVDSHFIFQRLIIHTG